MLSESAARVKERGATGFSFSYGKGGWAQYPLMQESAAPQQSLAVAHLSPSAEHPLDDDPHVAPPLAAPEQ